jgi:hypothetical protein
MKTVTIELKNRLCIGQVWHEYFVVDPHKAKTAEKELTVHSEQCCLFADGQIKRKKEKMCEK